MRGASIGSTQPAVPRTPSSHNTRSLGRTSEASMPSAAALTDAAADAAGGGDLDSALALVRRALALAPQSVPALVCLGNVLAERGDASGAATAYGVALQAAPHSFEAHANAGLLAAEQPGRRAAALAHLRAAIAINPGWGDGCYNLANLLSVYEATTAEKLEAVRLYERALRLSPADVEVLCNLADCLNDLALFERGEEVRQPSPL